MDLLGVVATEESGRFLELGGAILLLGLLARVSHRVGVSAIPLFLLVGLFFGKGGVYDLGFSDPFLETSSQFGAVLLLLLLGLEYSANEILHNIRTQGSAPYLDILLNAVPGALVGLLFGWGAVGAVAMAGITYISSSSVVALVLRELGWRRNPEVGPVVGLLVFEDLVMAPYLPALTAVLSGAGLLAGVISVGTAALVVLVTFLFALRGTHWMTGLLDPKHPLSLLLVVFGAALAAAGLAAFVGVSPAVAAFLVGLLVSGEVAQQARQALSPVRDLFAAIFFLFFGLSVDPNVLPGVMPAALALAVVTVAAKFVIGHYTVRNEDAPARLRAGALLSARGEFSVVIAGITVASGAAPAELAALAAAYVMMTAIGGPLLARVVAGQQRRSATA
jgi:CPA2 family monovalent cation:H+ antiporter-2